MSPRSFGISTSSKYQFPDGSYDVHIIYIIQILFNFSGKISLNTLFLFEGLFEVNVILKVPFSCVVACVTPYFLFQSFIGFSYVPDACVSNEGTGKMVLAIRVRKMHVVHLNFFLFARRCGADIFLQTNKKIYSSCISRIERQRCKHRIHTARMRSEIFHYKNLFGECLLWQDNEIFIFSCLIFFIPEHSSSHSSWRHMYIL